MNELWFEGYVGIDKRIAVSRLPEKYSVEFWEALDQCIDSDPTVQIDDGEQGFYRFSLEVFSGWEGSSDGDFGFEITDWSKIK